MQRHLSASKPGDAGKLFFEGMCGRAVLFRSRRADRRAGSQGKAINFDRRPSPGLQSGSPTKHGAADMAAESDTLPTATRVSDPGIRALYRLENRWQAWLDVEVALARAQAELGIIPAAAAEAIALKARLDLM